MIVRKTWLEVRWLAIIYFAVMLGILLPAIHLWPDLKILADQLRLVLPMTKTLSKSPIIHAAIDAMQSYQGYYALQHFFKGANVCGGAAAVVICTGLISRERETNTIEFLLSRPLSRSRVLLHKTLVAAACVLVPLFLVPWIGIPLSTWMVGESLSFSACTAAAWHNACFVSMIIALTVWCSVEFRTQAYTAAAVGTVLVTQITLYMTQTLRTKSLFHLSDLELYTPILLGQGRPWELFWSHQIWMLLVSVVLYGIAAFRFRRLEL